MALITAGIIAAGVGIGTGVGALVTARPRAGKGGTGLFGNHLESIPRFYFIAKGHIPFIVEHCCEDLERRAKGKDENPDWVAALRAANPAHAETETLQEYLDKFRDVNTRHHKKIKLKNLEPVDVLDILLFYLYVLPEPLCSEEGYPLFKEINNGGKSDKEKASELVQTMLKLPSRNRMVTWRIITMCNTLVNYCSESELAGLITEKFAPVIFSEGYPKPEVPFAEPEEEPKEKEKEKKSFFKKMEKLNVPLQRPTGDHLPSLFKLMITEEYSEMNEKFEEIPVPNHP